MWSRQSYWLIISFSIVVLPTILNPFHLPLMPYSQYRTASKNTTYILRFGVAFTLQAGKFMHIGVWPNVPVLQLPSEVRMRPCDIVAECPFTSSHLMSPCYTERRLSHNVMYTVDYTFSYCSKKFILRMLVFVCACPWYQLQRQNFINILKLW